MEISAPELFFSLAGLCMALHVAFAWLVRFAMRSDENVLDEVFGFSVFGRFLTYRPHLMRLRLFLPWVPLQSLAGYSLFARSVVWAARLFGTGFIASLLGFGSSVVYMALRGS